MDDILYFAYGSNLLRERLHSRCHGAVPAGLATLRDHRLTFDKVSTDGSGKCAFEPSTGDHVYGALYRVHLSDLDALDQHEGVGHGYERTSITLAVEGGPEVRATTYTATKRRPALLPYDWYLALVLAGAVQNRLPERYLRSLQERNFKIDPEISRASRREALEVLEAAGAADLLRLLVERSVSAR